MSENKKNIASKINEFAATGKPFLFAIDYAIENLVIKFIDEINPDEILFEINSFGNANNLVPKNLGNSFQIFPVTEQQYEAAFNLVVKNINYGNSYLTNLTFPTKVETDLSLRDIFLCSKAKYKLLIEDKFVVFSPEPFVNINNGIISSYPMKGTIDASLPNAEKLLLEDEKELAEHYTIVDLIRNDLSMVASRVRVDQFRYVETIVTNRKTILQTSSKISGLLPDNYVEKLGDILVTLLPAGSITGAPKAKTVEIIRDAENYERGFYTGIFGIFDGRDLDSCVMIRFIENINGELYYKSGGGITSKSNMKSEYQELIDKIYVPSA